MESTLRLISSLIILGSLALSCRPLGSRDIAVRVDTGIFGEIPQVVFSRKASNQIVQIYRHNLSEGATPRAAMEETLRFVCDFVREPFQDFLYDVYAWAWYLAELPGWEDEQLGMFGNAIQGLALLFHLPSKSDQCYYFITAEDDGGRPLVTDWKGGDDELRDIMNDWGPIREAPGYGIKCLTLSAIPRGARTPFDWREIDLYIDVQSGDLVDRVGVDECAEMRGRGFW